MRTDAMIEKGDLEGYAVWRRILRTVQELVDLAGRQRPLAKRYAGDDFAAGTEHVCARLAKDRLEAWPA